MFIPSALNCPHCLWNFKLVGHLKLCPCVGITGIFPLPLFFPSLKPPSDALMQNSQKCFCVGLRIFHWIIAFKLHIVTRGEIKGTSRAAMLLTSPPLKSIHHFIQESFSDTPIQCGKCTNEREIMNRNLIREHFLATLFATILRCNHCPRLDVYSMGV